MNSRSYFGKMNSTLGSVVPLAMFLYEFMCHIMTDYTTVCFHTNPKFSCTDIIELLRVDSIAFSIQRSHTPRSEAEIMFDLHSRSPERYSLRITTTNQPTNRAPNVGGEQRRNQEFRFRFRQCQYRNFWQEKTGKFVNL